MTVSAPERTRISALLAPKVLIPVVLVLAVACTGLGVAYAMKDGVQDLTLTTCESGTPGCELRQAIHDHANFALFIDGQRFDFDKPQFISEESNELSPAAHIHEPRIDVVHVHYSNTTWDEFFRSIGFDLQDRTTPIGQTTGNQLTLPDGTVLKEENGKTFKFYVNGVKVDGVSFTNIGDLDRVLISYGAETPEQVEATQLPQLGDDACIPSVRCESRIPPDEPEEPCTRNNATCGN